MQQNTQDDVDSSNGPQEDPENIWFQDFISNPKEIQLKHQNLNCWAPDIFITSFFNAFSIILPQVEMFVIYSVKAFESSIENEPLIKKIKKLYRQEASHTILHRRYNDLLQEYGYVVTSRETIPEFHKKLPLFRKFFTDKYYLALTVGGEFFVASVAEYSSRHPAILGNDKEGFTSVWKLHFTEEIEHKAVSFDLYNEIGGGYIHRCIGILHASFIMACRLTVETCKILKKENQLWSLSTWRAGASFLFGRKGLAWYMIKSIFKSLGYNYSP